jgi:hypothetical protein
LLLEIHEGICGTHSGAREEKHFDKDFTGHQHKVTAKV